MVLVITVTTQSGTVYELSTDGDSAAFLRKGADGRNQLGSLAQIPDIEPGRKMLLKRGLFGRPTDNFILSTPVKSVVVTTEPAI